MATKMVSKKSFLQNGRLMQQRRISYNKKFSQVMPTSHLVRSSYNQMFTTSQIPDNPGYMDFNLPTPEHNCTINNAPKTVTITKPNINNSNPTATQNANGDSNNSVLVESSTTENNTALLPVEASEPTCTAVKKKNAKLKQKGKQQQHLFQHKVGWRHISQQQPHQQHTKHSKKFYNSSGINLQSSRISFSRQFKNRRGGGGGIGGRSVMLPVAMVGPEVLRGSLSRPFINKSIAPRAFQPPNIFPPIPPPMVRHLPLPLVYMRHGNGPMPPTLPALSPMRMPRNIASHLPAIHISDGGGITPRIMKNFTKGKSTIKTLKNLINQYPMEKPWVTEEIRAEYDKKVDIEERLKGNKDDDLFAQFKVQRDKFVSMYESARDEYIKQEAAAVKAKRTLPNMLQNPQTLF